jgi:hypothetical protein
LKVNGKQFLQISLVKLEFVGELRLQCFFKSSRLRERESERERERERRERRKRERFAIFPGYLTLRTRVVVSIDIAPSSNISQFNLNDGPNLHSTN